MTQRSTPPNFVDIFRKNSEESKRDNIIGILSFFSAKFLNLNDFAPPSRKGGHVIYFSADLREFSYLLSAMDQR